MSAKKNSRFSKIVDLILLIRPDQAANINKDWLAAKLEELYSGVEFSIIRSQIEHKLTYYKGTVTHPVIIGWIEECRFRTTKQQRDSRSGYFRQDG